MVYGDRLALGDRRPPTGGATDQLLLPPSRGGGARPESRFTAAVGSGWWRSAVVEEKRVAAVNDGRNNGAVVVIGAGFDGRLFRSWETTPGNSVTASEEGGLRPTTGTSVSGAARIPCTRYTRSRRFRSTTLSRFVYQLSYSVPRPCVPQRAPLPLPVIE